MDGINEIDITDIEEHQCIPCIESATKGAHIPTPVPKVTAPLELTYTDISGKLSFPSLAGCRYFTVFLDDATERSVVFFLHKKSDLTKSLSEYKAVVENILNRRMQRIRLDKAGEHIWHEIRSFASQHGILMEYSPAYAPQSNGSAERLLQELWKVARTFLSESGLNQNLWAEAISHANGYETGYRRKG